MPSLHLGRRNIGYEEKADCRNTERLRGNHVKRKMKRNTGVHGRRRLRRRVAAGALLFGVSSLLGAGAASPAHASGPTTTLTCSASGAVTQRWSGFPANEALQFFLLTEQPDGNNTVIQGFSINFDSTGSASIGPYNSNGIPSKITDVFYRDSTSNGRWDPDVDQTIYRATGTLNSCPSSVVAAPK